MYTVLTMYATFVVPCWVNMRPFNSTHPTNLQLYSNQSTNDNPLDWDEGAPKSIFALSPHICRLVPGLNHVLLEKTGIFNSGPKLS